MKQLLTILSLLMVLGLQAQNKEQKKLIERTYLLSHTVFGTKDSLTLEDLFATPATYGHSGGKLQTRSEAIADISHNKSVYTDTAVSNVSVILHKDVAIVRHIFNGTETKSDGKATVLHLGMILTWVREKGKWRLLARQAYKI